MSTPAYPGRTRNNTYGTEHFYDGMELRDAIAIEAMGAIILRATNPVIAVDAVADSAYAFADAMERARTRPPKMREPLPSKSVFDHLAEIAAQVRAEKSVVTNSTLVQ